MVMAAVELPDGGIQCYEQASHYRQVNGEVATFVMQAAEAQLVVTKQPLGYAVSRKELVRDGLKHPLAREPVATPRSAQATAQRRSFIFRDCEQPEGLMNSETKRIDCRMGQRRRTCGCTYFRNSDRPSNFRLRTSPA